eukprot:CAMPEP_0177789844 /NCGR_PEP_ID=MMETSP0491_2-20121128/23001_1 /TAXON_ID=63592 /ORGANISM="Tetraselmis chuii, Strain PLY429" /LENGTH=338 /DNA_ID=CAMNT_0019311805 /DNA_START=58 /DNA_END=1076 /DNA_ORIENTATION=+
MQSAALTSAQAISSRLFTRQAVRGRSARSVQSTRATPRFCTVAAAKLVADAGAPERQDGAAVLSKRQLFALAGLIAAAPLVAAPPAATAAPKRVLVVGATGATGRLVVEALKSISGVEVLAGVRNLDKARSQGLESDGVQLVKIDDSADTVICATGFVPGINIFKMGEQAHAVDNVGTVNLVDAAKQAGVSKFVLVSSILTNGRGWGQADSAGFKITNAFGGVLDEKLVAEKHLKASGLDYTIVRPGGLKNEQSGKLAFSGEDTLASGEVDRALVAKVMAQAAVSPSSSKKVVEIIETGTCATKESCPQNLAAAPADPTEWAFNALVNAEARAEMGRV